METHFLEIFRDACFEKDYKCIKEILPILRSDVPSLRECMVIACSVGHLEVLHMVRPFFWDVSYIETYPLEVASCNGNLEIVKYLVGQGVKIHWNCDAPLRAASESGRYNVVKFLIESGADIHADDESPLCDASMNGYKDIVSLLLRCGADPCAKDNDAIRGASFFGYFSIVRKLIDYGANPSKIHHQTTEEFMVYVSEYLPVSPRKRLLI
jgi:ankyrin repeat protein